MKNNVLLSLILLLVSGFEVWAQRVPIRSQSFEANEPVNYTSNTFDLRGSGVTLASNQYFTITDTNPPRNPSDASNYSFGASADPIAIKNSSGTANYSGRFWIAEGVRCTNNTSATCGRDPGNVTLTAFDARGYDNIEVTVSLADPRGPNSFTVTGAPTTPGAGSFNAADKIEIQYSTDNGATYTTIGRFSGNNNNGSSGFLELDEDLDTDVNDQVKATLNYRMTDYTFGNSTFATIPSSPASLMVRVVVDERGASEEIAFDNIRVTGIPTAVQPPTLSDAQTATINYNEGDGATQVTSTIAAGSATGITSATVTIVSNVLSSDDELTFTPIANVIGGTYANGVLSLTGNATAAQYQTVLQSVRYRNSNGSTARGGNRAVQFVVRNGTSTSSTVTRNVLVKALLSSPATLPYTQDFTSDEEGTRYSSNTFIGSNGFAFTRTNVTPSPLNTGGITFTNISNGFYWYGVNVNAALQNPERVGRLETQQVDATNFGNLRFSIRLGASSGSGARWQNTDSFKMYYRTGGSSGTWKLFGSFRGNTTATNGTGDLKQDRPEDLASLPTLPAGTATVTPALTNFDFTLPADANRQLVDFKLELIADDGAAEFAFDLIRVVGDQLPTVTTSAAATITNSSAILGGTVNGNGTTVTERGVVYSSSDNTPTIGEAGVVQNTNPSTTSPFSESIAGLTAATTYYVRAYATNAAGTSYGAVESFTTQTTVASIVRANANPTNASSVDFTVTFANSVTGVNTNNFGLTLTGGFTTFGNVAAVSGSGTTYTVTVNTGAGSGTIRLNLANSSSISPSVSNVGFSGETYDIDKTAPTVSSVAVPANNTYRTGNTLSFTVNLSESVTVAGTPQLGLTIGSTSRLANYASGSGTAALVFSYTVQANDADADGIAVGALGLNGGTIRDAVGNNATLTLNGVPATTGIRVDGVAPTVSSSSRQAPAANPTNATSLTYRVTFSEAVTGVDAADFALSTAGSATGTLASATGVSGSTTVYDVVVNGVSGDGTIRLDVKSSGTGIIDGAGNALNGGYTAGQPYTLDRTGPAAILSNSNSVAAGSTTQTTPLSFTATFNEAVTGFDATDISVTNGSASGFTAVSTTAYTFSVAPTGNGTVTVNIAAGRATDAVGNGNSVASFSFVYQQPVMATAQNVTVQLNANGTATLSATSVNNGSTGPGTLTYTIQKVVYGQVPENQVLPLSTPSGDNFVAIRFASYGTPTGSNGNYALGGCNAGNSTTVVGGVLIGNPSGSIGANNGTFGDPCGNVLKSLAVVAAYSANAASLTYACTEAGKTQYVLLTVTDGSGNTSTMTAQVTVVAPPTASFTLNPTAGNIGAIITATGSNLGGATALTVNGATATISNLTAGGFSFVVPAGAALGAGSVVLTTPCDQAPGAAFTVTQPVTAAPVVTAPANNSRTNNSNVSFTGTAPANSQVLIYVAQGGVAVSGSPFNTTAQADGSFSFGPTALADGTFTVSATAQTTGSSVSTNSNTNTFTVDTTRPTVVLTSSSGASGSTNVAAPFAFTATFSEGVSGFVAGDLSVTNGTVTNFTGTSGGSAYTFNVTPASPGVVTSVYVFNNSNQDLAGNLNTVSNTYSLTSAPPVIVVSPTIVPDGTVATAYSQALTASGGTAPYTFAVTSGALPTGLALTAAGVLSGTPTAGGSFSFTITATDAAAAPGPFSGSRSYTVAIAVPASVTWTGAISSDWFTAGNWSPAAVPAANTSVVIPAAVPNYPAVSSGTANVRVLTLNPGATFAQTGGTLVVAANLTNNGTFRPTGGTVSLGSAALSNILGSSNTRFWDLTVEANGAQSSTAAGTSVQHVLTLSGNFNTNGNPFTLESNVANTAMVVNNGSNAIVGTATVQRYIASDLNPNLGYRHVSAPISNATVSSLATPGFTPVVNPAYNTSATPTAETPFPTVYGYDQARLATTTNNLATFDKGWFSPAALSDALTVGQGYTVNLTANQTWNFVGTPNNGTVTQTLARNSGATAADAGLHLVGNPYPSPLDWSLVDATERPNVDGIIYKFASNDPANPYAGQYSFYNSGFGNMLPVLSLGQGFFVRVASGQTSGTLNLKNRHRVTGYTNPTYHRSAETRPVVHLTLQGAGKPQTDDAFVYFEAGATNGLDAQYDGLKLANPSGLNLSSNLSATERLCVNGLAPLGAAQRIVPLAVGVPAAGSYNLNAAEVLNLSTTPVYLRDQQTGAVIDLRTQPSYSFVVSNASVLITSRFELVFSPQAVLATAPAALAAQVGVYPNPATTTAFVELPAALGRVAVAAELVDALGRTVRTQSLPAQGAVAHRLDLTNLATGVYTLHLNTMSGVVVKKLVVQ